MKNLLNKLETAIWWEDVAGVIHNDGSLPSGLRGDVTGLRGNVTDCELTPEDRANGVDISTLVGDGL